LHAVVEVEEAGVHFGAARHFDDRARYARQGRGTPAVVMGEGPDDLPIGHPATFALTINLKSAETPGFDIPQQQRLRAGDVNQ
jgi:hypothetical protein